jgi:hypothetical protein
MTENPSKAKPIRDRRLSPRDWSISDVPERQCTAHKRNGDRCKNAAIRGGNVCGYHGGNAPAVKAKARLRLEMASDRLARQLINMTSDPNVADSVKLAAIKDALDRSGLAAKNAVSVEVGISKRFERVFDSIMAGPRDAQPALAIEDESAPAIEPNAEILGEFDDPPPEDEIEDDPPRIQHDWESESSVIDVEIVAAQYTDEIMSESPGTAYPDQDQIDLSGDPGFTPGPLGLGGPVGSGLMPLSDAVEAAAEMRAREAARLRNMRRR